MSAARIETANKVMDLFVPGVTLHQGRELRIKWTGVSTGRQCDYPARLRGHWLCSVPRHRTHWGGTCENAIAQLILYVRDRPRLPMVTWEYWTAPTGNVKLGREEARSKILPILRASDYNDPKKTCCVLCGASPCVGLDWWSLDGVEGPCCSMGKCLESG